MKNCPYCGYGNENTACVCDRCRASLLAEQPKEQPKKAEKKTDKE